MKSNKVWTVDEEIVTQLVAQYVVDNYDDANEDTPVSLWLVYDEDDNFIAIEIKEENEIN